MTTAARARMAAAIAVGLLALWTTAQAAWSFTHPVWVSADAIAALHDQYGDEALGDSYDDEAMGDGYDEQAVGRDDDEALDDESASERAVEPAGADAPERDVVIGDEQEPLEPVELADLLAARRARDEALARLDQLDDPPLALEDDGAIELADDLEAERSDAPSEAASLPASEWALWFVWAFLFAMVSFTLAWFGRAAGRTAALVAAACFGAISVGSGVSMLAVASGAPLFWLDTLTLPLIAVGAVLGTWAASAPRRVPIALVAGAIVLELLSPLIWADGFAPVPPLYAALFVLAFALRPIATEESPASKASA